MNKVMLLCSFAIAMFAAGCGGDNSSSSLGTTSPVANNPVPPPRIFQNFVPLIVDAGPADKQNIPFISIKICAPGSTTNCQTIDHVAVDTGSSGLHIVVSVLSPGLLGALAPVTASNGQLLTECEAYVTSYVWGSIKTADVYIGDEVAKSVPTQIIADPASQYAVQPDDCSIGHGSATNDVASYGSNGLIGVGVNPTSTGLYYLCPVDGCTTSLSAVIDDAQYQIPSVATLFSTDNNGVILSLPNVPDGGAPSVQGALIFGIGTRSNNGLGGATVYASKPGSGDDLFNTVFNGVTYNNSYADSGTSTYDVNFNNAVPVCSVNSGDLCPTTPQSFTAKISSWDGSTVSPNIPFNVGNADALLSSGNRVFNNLATPATGQTFVWGLPFFLGKKVFTGISGKVAKDASGNTVTGPFTAF